eukprot:TRINITY_DN16436_c0_g1_i1.p1 TRINITY_DN16436_c0_g1~~TRINITY_DN16436_c0_g1_i1.p1  ORF type:complete len:589 (-),score=61.91 TRINITY_DN16436_c0_g1_i1:47-1813(-)
MLPLRQRPTKGSGAEGELRASGSKADLLAEGDDRNIKSGQTLFDARDKQILIVFAVLGLITRFWTLGYPKSVMFDEAHFTKFISCYFTGEYFFDIHPPLAKLLMALVGNWGISSGNTPIEQYAGDYRDDFYFYLRLLPAFCGSMLIPVSYASCRALRLSRLASCIGPWYLLLDNLLLIESRTAVTDGVLLFFVSLSFFSCIMMNYQTVFSSKWFFWTVMTGASLGCSISVKLTALAIIATVGLLQVWDLFRLYIKPALFSSFSTPAPRDVEVINSNTNVTRTPSKTASNTFVLLVVDAAVRGLILLGLIFFIHYLCWHIHFKMLIYNGEGNPFMEPRFINTFLKPPPNLPYHCFHEPQKQLETFPPGAYTPMSTLSAMFHIHKTIHVVNFGLRASHPTASKWYQWPLMQCKVVPFYYGQLNGQGVKILSIGNVITWYLLVFFIAVMSAALVASWALDILKLRTRWGMNIRVVRIIHQEFNRYRFALMMTLGGYVLNLVPFALVPRITWIYHYQPSLIHGMLMMSVSAQITLSIAEKLNSKKLHQLTLLFWALTVCAATMYYYYFFPWIYGRPLSNEEHNNRMWIKEWV